MKYSFFPSKIRALRQQAGYTQAEVSSMLNIQRQTYCNYENASRTPTLEIVIELADIYHVSVDYLVHDGSTSVHPGRSEAKFLAEFLALPEDAQKEVLDFIAFKKQK